MSIEDTDIEKLADMLDKHKEACFHKRTCIICKLHPGFDYRKAQCDYCGILYDGGVYCSPLYQCACENKVSLDICNQCRRSVQHYELIKEPFINSSNKFVSGVYLNDCCPITKGVKDFKK